MNDDILQEYKFAIKLDARDNPKITNINHMVKLKVLRAFANCGIDDYGIKKLNLEKLDASCNPRISHVNHM